MRRIAGISAGVLSPLLAGVLFAYASRETASILAKMLLATISALLVGLGAVFFIKHIGIPYMSHGKKFLATGIAILFTGYYVRYIYGLGLAPDAVFYTAVFGSPMYLASWLIGVIGGQQALLTGEPPRPLIHIILLASSRILLLLAGLVGVTLLLGTLSAGFLSPSVPLSFKDKALVIEAPLPRLVDLKDVVGSIRIFPGRNDVLVNYTTGVSVVGRVPGIHGVKGSEDLVGRTVDLPNGVMEIDEDLAEKILEGEPRIDMILPKNSSHVLRSSPRPVKLLLDNVVGPLVHMLAPLLASRATQKILAGLLFLAIGLTRRGV